MTITSLFVEIVVSGAHTLLWIGLAVLAFAGYQTIDFEKLLNINLAVPALAFAYILGIIMDRLSDSVFMRNDIRLREIYKNRFKNVDAASFLAMRFYILKQSKEIYEQLEYTRSRLRITRTAILNFPLTALAALLFVWKQLGPQLELSNLIFISVLILLIGGLLTFLAYRSWVGLTLNYSVSVYIAYQELSKNTQQKPDNSK